MFDLADELLAEDNEIKKREKEASENNYLNFAADYSFNDILCSDLKPNMRKLIEDVCCVDLPRRQNHFIFRFFTRRLRLVSLFLMRALLKCT